MGILLPPWEAGKRFRNCNIILEIFTVGPDMAVRKMTRPSDRKKTIFWCEGRRRGGGTLGEREAREVVSVTFLKGGEGCFDFHYGGE